MSETGHCNRVLSAIKLNEPAKQRSDMDEDRLEHYSRLEAVAAEKLEKEGFEVLDSGECKICNNGRCGWHIEIEEGLFKLVGHLDRRVNIPDILIDKKSAYDVWKFKEGLSRQLPVEIKSLGPESWKRFEAYQFKEFMSYAYQECCYLHQAGTPGIYWVMNRDSGKCLKYIVNDFKKEYQFPGFTNITLPITYDQIIDKLNAVEIEVAEGKLCDPTPNEDCHWCLYSHLCTDSSMTKKFKIFVDDAAVKQAALDYKQAKESEDLAKDQKEKAVAIMTSYAKIEGNDKFKTNGISFSYHGLKYRTTIDGDALAIQLKMLNMTNSEGKKVTYDDIMSKVQKRSKGFDSYTIKVIDTPEKT
jgi:hypothetical protein